MKFFNYRVKDSGYKYLPKPYQVDKVRHQKHLIEDNPKTAGKHLAANLNQESEEGFDYTDKEGEKDESIHEDDQMEVPQVIKNLEFLHSPDKSSEKLLKDIRDSQKYLSSMINHANEHKMDPEDARRRDDSQGYLSSIRNVHDGDERTKIALSQLVGPPKNIMDASVDNGGYHDVFMDRLRQDSNTMSTTNDQGSIFVGANGNQKSGSMEITPVSGPMNPEVNDEERLNEFNTYARRKNSIQDVGNSFPLDDSSGYQRSNQDQHSINDHEVEKFVSEIMTDTKGKAMKLPNDVHQLQFLKHMQESALKVLGNEYKFLQKNVMDKYIQTDTDKLDNDDKAELQRLGYNDMDFSNINKEVQGHSSNSEYFKDVGIDVNGKKMGNVGLLLDNIPRVDG